MLLLTRRTARTLPRPEPLTASLSLSRPLARRRRARRRRPADIFQVPQTLPQATVPPPGVKFLQTARTRPGRGTSPSARPARRSTARTRSSFQTCQATPLPPWTASTLPARTLGQHPHEQRRPRHEGARRVRPGRQRDALDVDRRRTARSVDCSTPTLTGPRCRGRGGVLGRRRARLLRSPLHRLTRRRRGRSPPGGGGRPAGLDSRAGYSAVMADRLGRYRTSAAAASRTSPGVGEPPTPPRPARRPALRDPEARRDPAPLRLPARAGRCAIVGGAEGPVDRPARQAPRVEVEDHPLDYADFEGVIGRGYGAGPVIVGTRALPQPRRGPVATRSRPATPVLARGREAPRRLVARAHGRRRQAPVAADQAPTEQGADARRRPQSTQPESVKTGRTIEQVAEERRA